MGKLKELLEKRNALLQQAQDLVAAAEAEDRNLTEEEQATFDDLMAQVDDLKARIERAEKLENETRNLRQPMRQPVKPEPDSPIIGMSRRDLERYSLLRAMRAAASRDWRGAELEKEASDAVAAKMGAEPRGFYLPFDVLLEKRGLVKGTNADGGYLVADEPLTFIESLKAKMVLTQAGAQFWTGLVGDVPVTSEAGTPSMYWVAEDSAPTEGGPTFTQTVLQPKSAAAMTYISRKMLLQSSIDVERYVWDLLAGVIARGIEYAALHGDGASNNPTGIAATSGVSVVAIGTDGGNPTWSHIVDLETQVAVNDADLGRLAYVTNPNVRGYLKTAEKSSGTGQYIWQGGQYPLNGYRALVTTQVRNDLTKGVGTSLSAIFFGNWGDLVIGQWGGLDILVDPYSLSDKGAVRLVAFQDVDVLPLHPESFAVILDAATV